MTNTLQAKGTLAELLLPLSFASDLNLGQPMEHALKTVWIAMQLAETLALGLDDRVAVYYGGILKDAG
ncbi:MAG: hypothetical protein ACE5I2_12810 [Anaerolineae bacterium]